MSSLIFYTDEQEALIATDTLVVDATSKKHKTYSSKAFFIPHINTILASTGIAGFADQWLCFINSNLNATDVESLSLAAKPHLIQLFEWYNSQVTNNLNLSVTIYHFGFSKSDEKIKAFAHRSEHDFEPELLQYGLGAKPFCKELQAVDHTPQEIIPIAMRQQILEQQSVPEQKRVYIGGEIFTLHLKQDGCFSYKLGEL